MSILILGGGIAGITAATYLGEQGQKVALIEREEGLGGRLNNLFSVYDLGISPKDFVSRQITKLKKFSNVDIFTCAELIETKGHVGNFNSKLKIKNSKPVKIKHGAIIIATGVNVSAPKMDCNSQKIINHTHLEDYISNNKIKRLSKVIFLCDFAKEDSQIIALSTLKNALLLREKLRCEVSVLSRNIKVAGKKFEQLYTAVREKGVIFSAVEGVDVEGLHLICDWLVIGESILPDHGTEVLSLTLGVERDKQGFFQNNNVHFMPNLSNRKGIFFAGACHIDAGLNDILDDSLTAAYAAHNLLEKNTIEIDEKTAEVDEEKCALCLTCIRSCPHKAIDIEFSREVGKKAAKIVEEACFGCGICASLCPSRAIQLREYEDEKILKLIG
ncbi:CoB--CoM heterodisulfide reductase iron-sulfur subunit A family protein [bacterium]|nr:CoB--CoM heterodisulfide reductase iron-sulfur subunit A family protein [bacterium]